MRDAADYPLKRTRIVAHRAALFCLTLPAIFGAVALAQNDKTADYDVTTPPAWVEIMPLPATANSKADLSQGPVRYALVDRQIRVDGPTFAYIHLATRLLTQVGVDRESQLKVEFDPQNDRLHIHSVTVHRGAESIDELTKGRIEILHRERNLEEGILDGRLTFHLVLSDVRVGDTVDYSYTLEHRNPEWDDRYFGHYTTQWDDPVEYSRLRVWTRAKAPLYVLSHDAGQATPSSVSGWKRLEWTWKDLPPLISLSDTPAGFEQHPSIELSQFANWKEVEAVAAPLFDLSGEVSPARAALIARLRAAGSTDGERVLAAIRYVQEEIRYTGIELGQGAYRPRPPEEVLAQRYGDCKDKSQLAVSLLRGLGVEADPVLVSTRWRTQLRQRLASPGALNHVIVRARFGGSVYWFDVTQTGQGGDLDHFVQADWGAGLVIEPATEELTTIPRAEAETPRTVVSEIYDLTKGTNQDAGLAVATRYRGAEADAMRRQLRGTTPQELSQNYLNYYKRRYDSIRSVEALQIKDDMQANEITIVEHYRAEHLFSANQKGKMEFDVNAFLLGDRLKAPSTPVRKIPLALDFPINVVQQIEIRLAEDWPTKDDHVSVNGPGFRYDSHTSRQGNDIHLDYHYRTSNDQVSVGQLAEFLAKREEARLDTYFDLFYTPAPDASQADITKAQAALKEAAELALKGETKKVEQAVQQLMALPGYAGLNSDQRHAALLLAGGVEFDLKNWAQALSYLQQCSVMDAADITDWEFRLRTALEIGNQAEATQSLTEIARRWPQSLHTLDDSLVSATVGRAPATGSGRYGLLKALFEAHYEPQNGADLSQWWVELGQRELERGEQDAALAGLSEVKSPYALVKILADNRYEPIRTQLTVSLDVSAAAARRVEETRSASASSPKALTPLLIYADALMTAQRYEEVLQTMDEVISKVGSSKDRGGYTDYDRVYVWVLDNRARALQALGRWDEAVTQLIEASHMLENRSDNVSQVINLAGLYNELGRPRDARAALAGLGVRGESPYGLMQVANESLSAAIQLGDSAEIEHELNYMKEHLADSVRTYEVGLVNANRLDEASQLLQSRLTDPDRRADALVDVQTYAHPAMTIRDKEFMKRWQDLLNRPDVAAAIRKVGSIGSYAIIGIPF